MIDLLFNCAFQLIAVSKVVRLLAQTDDFLCQLDAAFAALCPYFRQCHIYAELLAFCFYKIKLCLCIGRECVDRYDARKLVYVLDVGNMLEQVRDTLFKCLDILVVQVSLCNASVVLQCTNCCHDNNCTRMQIRHTALDIQELLCTEVCTEACLCDRIVSQF